MSDVGYTEFQPHAINTQEINSRGFAMAPAGVRDDGKIVGFRYEKEFNAQKSAAAGVRQFDDKVYVRIQNPGEKDYIDREVREEDKRRWPNQWAAFIQGRKYVMQGTPLDLLFPDRPSICATLEQFNIHTVQQLANLDANAIGRVGIGAQEWVNKAQAYLKMAEKGVDFHRFNAERQKWSEEKAAMQKQINDLAGQLQQVVQAQRNQPMQQGYGMPQQGYDAQSHLIGNSMAERYPAMQTVPTPVIPEAPDLGSQVSSPATQPAPRRGRPAGSKNKPKETI